MVSKRKLKNMTAEQHVEEAQKLQRRAHSFFHTGVNGFKKRRLINEAQLHMQYAEQKRHQPAA